VFASVSCPGVGERASPATTLCQFGTSYSGVSAPGAGAGARADLARAGLPPSAWRPATTAQRRYPWVRGPPGATPGERRCR
jgi:hypothetical protein